MPTIRKKGEYLLKCFFFSGWQVHIKELWTYKYVGKTKDLAKELIWAKILGLEHLIDLIDLAIIQFIALAV